MQISRNFIFVLLTGLIFFLPCTFHAGIAKNTYVIGGSTNLQNVTFANNTSESESQDTQLPPQQPQESEFNISSNELQSFAEAMQMIETKHKELQEKSMVIVEDEGLSLQRFNVIMSQQQGFGSDDDTEPTGEEMQQYQNAQEKILELQEKFQEDAMAIFDDHGISMERYQEINMALEQDPELQQEFMQYFRSPGQPQPAEPEDY